VEKRFLQVFSLAEDVSSRLEHEDESSYMPLHGDIHHFNVLHSHYRGWLAIDPKGIFGPRAYEYANILCNPYMHQNIVSCVQRMGRQTDIICAESGLNREKLLSYTFLHAAQCAAWSLSEPDQQHWLSCLRTTTELAGFTPLWP
jgi:streptomycin 6-kinase